jgi:predicted amidohydrolase
MTTDVRLVVGLVQMQMGADPLLNLEHAIAGVRDAAAQGATLVCLPELFRSRYFCQSESAEPFGLAEAVPGPTTQRLAQLSDELGITLIASLFEARAPGLYHNTAAVLDAGTGYLGKYRKMHIPDDPRYYEKFYFTPGDLGFKAFPTRVGKVGVLVCWDQWYPEAALARRSCVIQRPLAGTLRRRRTCSLRNTMRGKSRSAHTQLPTAVMSSSPIGRASNRIRPAAAAYSSGAKVLLRRPTVASWCARRPIVKRCSCVSSIVARSAGNASVGRFFAIAASMPMAI